ncbi:acyl-CoA carboxylase epsilon subunit [Streptomyces sviceus]|uniref:acyl-CoA carboxylase epsilon subunit n=1 Tax=Streptomyces sviceus TaxID=285530 RepID=UPI003327CC40
MRPGRGRGRPGLAQRGGIAGSAPPGFGRGTVGVWPGDRARRRGAARRRGRPVVRIVCGWVRPEETAAVTVVGAARRRGPARSVRVAAEERPVVRIECGWARPEETAAVTVVGAARRRGPARSVRVAAEKRPLLRIVRGRATSEETAVLSAVVAARAVEGPPSPSGLGPARWYRGKRTAALRPGHSWRLTR